MGAASAGSKDTKRILISLVLGTVIGLIIYKTGAQAVLKITDPIGKLFITTLKMMIVPLVLSSIFMSIVNLGSPENLSKLGIKAIAYYTLTTAIAVFLGIIFVNLINPGVGLDFSAIVQGEMSEKISQRIATGSETPLFQTFINVILDAFPSNPFHAMANMKILQIIVFAMLLGMGALYIKKEAGPVVSFMESLEKLSMVLVHGLMKLAPIGIFCLMVQVVATAGVDVFEALGKYMATVIIGLFSHFLLLLFIGSVRHKTNPFTILRALGSPILTALSTASSAATLPLTMSAVEDNLGVKKETAQFVLPLGATINMDGTALYESVAVIFIGQAYGLDLSIGVQMVIFLTASLAAVGAAAIPGAGLVTMSIVLTAVGFPLDGIGLILAVDRILDMFRTSINVFGDCVGCIVLNSFDKEVKSAS